MSAPAGGRARRAWLSAVRAGAVLAAAGTVHAAVNLTRLRSPGAGGPDGAGPATGTAAGEVGGRVSVLLPARDEEHRVGPCVASLLAQRGVGDLEVLVLDDGSADATAAAVRAAAGGDRRLRLLDGGHAPPPPGWLGKPWACERLAEAATGSVLVFVDADVVLRPDAVAATVAALRAGGLDLLSPYPRQVAVGAAERLVQPLLVWSWVTTLPLGAAERSPRPSLAAATGQLLAVDAAAYRAAGGHAAVRGRVFDDIELLRALKRAGFRGVPADGSAVASCRMYTCAREVYDGYTKSLWAAFGSPAGAAAVLGLLTLAYVVPALAVAAGDRRARAAGAAGYAAAVAGRVLVARRTGGRAWPDALAHPAAVLAVDALTAASFVRRRRGTLRWKGRPVAAAG